MEVTRYPLSWPFGWKRGNKGGSLVTRFTSHGGKMTVSAAIDRLDGELTRLGAHEAVLSTNLKLGLRGDPLSGQAEPDDRGAAVYFNLNGKDRVLACDRWTSVAGNIAAIAAHIDALRRVDRYGVGSIEQAFAGYDALPPPNADNRPPWRTVLGFKPLSQVTPDDVQINYRTLAKAAALDEGRLLNLNLARDAAMQELGG